MHPFTIFRTSSRRSTYPPPGAPSVPSFSCPEQAPQTHHPTMWRDSFDERLDRHARLRCFLHFSPPKLCRHSTPPHVRTCSPYSPTPAYGLWFVASGVVLRTRIVRFIRPEEVPSRRVEFLYPRFGSGGFNPVSTETRETCFRARQVRSLKLVAEHLDNRRFETLLPRTRDCVHNTVSPVHEATP